jgi:hypothetical protein
MISVGLFSTQGACCLCCVRLIRSACEGTAVGDVGAMAIADSLRVNSSVTALGLGRTHVRLWRTQS